MFVYISFAIQASKSPNKGASRTLAECPALMGILLKDYLPRDGGHDYWCVRACVCVCAIAYGALRHDTPSGFRG